MQTDKEAFREIVRGAIVPTVVLVLFFTFILTLGEPDDAPREKFKVVDQYGPCEVVRYTDDTNRWHYFLDCK
jgi:hypothetical protein